MAQTQTALSPGRPGRPPPRRAASRTGSHRAGVPPRHRIHAARMKLRSPTHRDGDLVSSGVVGCWTPWTLRRLPGIKFKTYAEFRIRGPCSTTSEMDWFPRSARQHSTRLQHAYARLENVLGRPPEEERSRRSWHLRGGARKQLAMFTG